MDLFSSLFGCGTSVAERVTFELGLSTAAWSMKVAFGKEGWGWGRRRAVYFTCRFGFRLMVAKLWNVAEDK